MSIGYSEDFQNECLDAHNMYRAQHGCPPLQLNQQLTDAANKWAQVLIKRNILEHSIDNKYGENIYMAQGLTVTGDMPVKSWYEEVQDYNFNEPKFSPNTGHFTQVIWKNSKKLGVGIAHRGNLTYVVTNYMPAGNFIGRFKENVPVMLCLVTPRNSTIEDEIPETEPCKPKKLRMLAKKTKKRFRSECLDAHNQFRESHGVPPLELDDVLTSFATKWAQTLSKHGKLKHSATEQYGENIYMSEGIRVTGAAPVKIWYDEIHQYSFDAAKFSAASGGFTQIVWKDTKKLGVGIAKKGRIVIVVATYSPPGNVMGLFRQNVPPVGGFGEMEDETSILSLPGNLKGESLSQDEDDALAGPRRKSLDDDYYDTQLCNELDIFRFNEYDFDDNASVNTISSNKKDSY